MILDSTQEAELIKKLVKKSCKARLKLHNLRLKSLTHVALIPRFWYMGKSLFVILDARASLDFKLSLSQWVSHRYFSSIKASASMGHSELFVSLTTPFQFN